MAERPPADDLNELALLRRPKRCHASSVLFTHQRALGYGRGEHTITTAELDELLVDSGEVRDHVRRAFAAPDYHPPRLPAVAIEVQRMSTSKDVNFPAVVAVLERDPMLVSEILRVASHRSSRGGCLRAPSPRRSPGLG